MQDIALVYRSISSNTVYLSNNITQCLFLSGYIDMSGLSYDVCVQLSDISQSERLLEFRFRLMVSDIQW